MYEILLHDEFLERVVRAMNLRRKRRRRTDIELQDLVSVALDELAQKPRDTDSSANRRVAGILYAGESGVAYFLRRVGGRAGRRLYYCVIEKDKVVLPAFLTDQRKDVHKDKRNLEWKNIIRDIASDYSAKRMGRFTSWEGSF